MAVGKNKGLNKAGKKGSKKKVIDPFTRKDWYDVKSPALFTNRNVGKTLINRTQGTSSAPNPANTGDGKPAPDSNLDDNGVDKSAPDDNVDGNPTLTYWIIKAVTTQGRDKLFDSQGHSYTVKRTTSLSTTWRCSLRSAKIDCAATVKEFSGSYIPGRSHNHEPSPNVHLAASVMAVAKAEAMANPEMRACEIARKVFKENLPDKCPTFPSITRISANVRYQRRQMDKPKPSKQVKYKFKVKQQQQRKRKLSPEHNFVPKQGQLNRLPSINFELSLRHVPKSFLRFDLQMIDARHLFFATDEQINLLRNAKIWYIDIMFEGVKPPVRQLLTINTFVRQEDDEIKQLPIAVCAMSRCTLSDYVEVFRQLKILIGKCAVESCVVDFDESLWEAVAVSYPDIESNGCSFNFMRLLWLRIQAIDLTTAYVRETSTCKLLRKCMALCYLPTHHIAPVFNRVRRQFNSRSEAIERFFDYIQQDWISNSIWPPSSWSVYRQPVRSKDNMEWWHNRIVASGNPEMNLFMLVSLLYDEAGLVTMEDVTLSEEELFSYQCSRIEEFKIHKIWAAYEDGKASAKQILKGAAQLYGPDS